MQMSKVSKCDVTDCAYNMNNACHAMAITIGNAITPRCDTFCKSTTTGGDISCFASVGACKVSSCTYNASLECQAPEICVGYKSGEPDCLTFQES